MTSTPETENDSMNITTETDENLSGSKVNNAIETKKKPLKPQPSFSDRWQNSPYVALRVLYKILHSIWMAVMAVGMFLAWLIALLAT